jgi:hypothetical protein
MSYIKRFTSLYAGNVLADYLWGDGSNIYNINANGLSIFGNAIPIGNASQGNLVSNAVSLTANTTVTNSIALINQVLGKLVPLPPPAFPGNQTLSIASSGTSARMADFTQTNNTAQPNANVTVTAGTLLTVYRSNNYSTNTIVNTGPGDSGTMTAFVNGAAAGTVTFNTDANPNVNGAYGNLVISNNYDYSQANANIDSGFWYVFSAQAVGTVLSGWNQVAISHSSAGTTNAPVWYYDAGSPGSPQFFSIGCTPQVSPELSYSSTVPFYTGNNAFEFTFAVNRLSGDTYPNNGNILALGFAGGAFLSPTNLTYAAANVAVPLARNLYVSSGTVTANVMANVVNSGFGSSSTGPSVRVDNSYNSTTQPLTSALSGSVILYKNGNTTTIDETNITVDPSVGSGFTSAFRIVNPGGGNTPSYTANATAFNSQSSTLQTYDATVVGINTRGVMKHDVTNYSVGYLPEGPNLSAGRSGTQYFTFKFVRQDLQKFNINYTGTLAGLWVALPGSVIDTSSGLNGWMDMSQAYAGAGYPGTGAGGNGSDGCSIGGAAQLNTAVTNAALTCTFGTVSSSLTATNEIYVRIALTTGQSLSAISIGVATN